MTKLALMLTLGVTLVGISTAEPYSDEAVQEVVNAFRDGKTGIHVRFRHEAARQGALDKARATTLRTGVAYQTAEFNQADFKIELINVANFFGQSYDPGVAELAKPTHSQISDPKGTGLNQAVLSWRAFEATELKFGRFHINRLNRRFIGQNDYRQYPQSFDAFSIENKMHEDFTFFYAYTNRFNTFSANGRTPSGQRKLRTHIYDATWHGAYYGDISLFGYFNKDKTNTFNSHHVMGLSMVANDEFRDDMGLDYQVSLARQKAFSNNPRRYTAYYWLAEIGYKVDMLEAHAGIENLSGDSNATYSAFQTPLASTHLFQGYADAFIQTPDKGIRDYYVKINGKNDAIELYSALHYYQKTKGVSSKAGREVNIGLIAPLSEHTTVEVGYAKYIAKNIELPSTSRLWLSVSAQLMS